MQIAETNRAIPDSDDERLSEQILELGIKINIGSDMDLDRKQVDILLNTILAYPSTQEAERHRYSNRLGMLDVDQEEKERRFVDHMKPQESYNQICSCCGFILQDRDLQSCSHSFHDINNIGISTFVYFKTIFNLGILLAIMFIVYSTYSIGTNVYASNIDIAGNSSSSSLKFMSISLGSKDLYISEEKQKLYVIGAWIGCAMLVLWGVVFMALKYNQKESEVKILMQTKTVSEYSLVIQKMPTGMTKEEVQLKLNDYLKRIKQTEQVLIESLQIEKYNEGKPFYLNESQFSSVELKEVVSIYDEYKRMFADWLLQRRYRDQFAKGEKYRNRKYQQYERIINRKQLICNQMIEHIKEEYKKKNKENKTTVFITFADNHQKNFMLDHNPTDWIERLKDYIPFMKSRERFTISKNDIEYDLKIHPAPDPEDIIWSNIGVTNCEKRTRKLLTFSISAVILAISFVIVYGLSTVQMSNSNNFLISIVISLSISVINLLIILIKVLTKYERDYTMTNYQTSLAIKSIFAQIVNSVFIPIIACYFIKSNIYGENGLVQDVLILSITNSFVTPIVKIFDPEHYFKIVYAKYKQQPSQKLLLHQFELNEICERMEFEVGYEYIYVVNIFIFTCFFVSLQPIIPLFAIGGLASMYWAQKYSLFSRCQRPVPGTKIINTAMSQMIYFGTIAYTLGSLTWANFLPSSQFKSALLPNILSLSMAMVIFILPYESIFRRVFSSMRMPRMDYSDNRIFFTSEYDRLNPSTSEAGIKQYRSFLQTKKKELQKMQPEVKERLEYNLQLSNRPNFYKKPTKLFLSIDDDNNQAIIGNLLNRQSQNMLTPQMIANVLLPEKQIKHSSINHRRSSPIFIKCSNSMVRKRAKELKQVQEEAEQPTENLFKNAQIEQELQIPDVEMPQQAKPSSLSNIQPLPSNFDQKRDSQFLEDIMKVKSYIMRDDNHIKKPHKIQTDRQNQRPSNNQSSKQPSKVKRKSIDRLSIQSNKKEETDKNKQSYNNSRVKQGSERKEVSFRESMIHDLRDTFNCYEEVGNRFSINAGNIMPLCISHTIDERDHIGESEVKIYDLGSFQ